MNRNRQAQLAELDGNELRAVEEEAARGNPAALYILGIAYCRADGRNANRARGIELLRRSAALGYAPALRAMEGTRTLDSDIEAPAGEVIPFPRAGRRPA